MGRSSAGHVANPRPREGLGRAAAPATATSLATLEQAEREDLTLHEGDVIAAKHQVGYRILRKDLQRLEALKQRILTSPGESFADQVWYALAKSVRINPQDPWVRYDCKGKRPSDAKLLRFMISVLRRAAPEMLVAVRANASTIAGTMVNEALEVVHRHATGPIPKAGAPGAAVNLKAAAMLLKIAGIQAEGGDTNIFANQQVLTGGDGQPAVTADAMKAVAAARQQLYDDMTEGEDESTGGFEA